MSTKNDWDFGLTPKNATAINMQIALDWWHSLPVQDIYECKLGLANLCMKYYPSKTECYHFTGEEVLYMWNQENK